MLSLFVRNLFFTLLQPGFVAGLFPYLIVGESAIMQAFRKPMQLYQYLSIVLFTTGFLIMIACIRRFAVEGKGTLSPVDSTRQLVVKGLYRFSRNPMYIGVMVMLCGEALFFKAGDLWIYAVLVFVSFNIFILLHEEPRLQNTFGKDYQQYCKNVRRWF